MNAETQQANLNDGFKCHSVFFGVALSEAEVGFDTVEVRGSSLLVLFKWIHVADSGTIFHSAIERIRKSAISLLTHPDKRYISSSLTI